MAVGRESSTLRSAPEPNAYHGTFYEFVRNYALDAKNYFEAHAKQIPSFHMNQFGANLGGPVVLPHLFNGREITT